MAQRKVSEGKKLEENPEGESLDEIIASFDEFIAPASDENSPTIVSSHECSSVVETKLTHDKKSEMSSKNIFENIVKAGKMESSSSSGTHLEMKSNQNRTQDDDPKGLEKKSPQTVLQASTSKSFGDSEVTTAATKYLVVKVSRLDPGITSVNLVKHKEFLEETSKASQDNEETPQRKPPTAAKAHSAQKKMFVDETEELSDLSISDISFSDSEFDEWTGAMEGKKCNRAKELKSGGQKDSSKQLDIKTNLKTLDHNESPKQQSKSKASKAEERAKNEHLKSDLSVSGKKENGKQNNTSLTSNQTSKRPGSISVDSKEKPTKKAKMDGSSASKTSAPEPGVSVNDGRQEKRLLPGMKFQMSLWPVLTSDLNNEAFRKFINLASDVAVDFMKCPPNISIKHGVAHLYFVDMLEVQSALKRMVELTNLGNNGLLWARINCFEVSKVQRPVPDDPEFVGLKSSILGRMLFEYNSRRAGKLRQLLPQLEKKTTPSKTKSINILKVPNNMTRDMMLLLFPFSIDVQFQRNKNTAVIQSGCRCVLKFASDLWMQASLTCFTAQRCIFPPNGPETLLKLEDFSRPVATKAVQGVLPVGCVAPWIRVRGPSGGNHVEERPGVTNLAAQRKRALQSPDIGPPQAKVQKHFEAPMEHRGMEPFSESLRRLTDFETRRLRGAARGNEIRNPNVQRIIQMQKQLMELTHQMQSENVKEQRRMEQSQAKAGLLPSPAAAVAWHQEGPKLASAQREFRDQWGREKREGQQRKMQMMEMEKMNQDMWELEHREKEAKGRVERERELLEQKKREIREREFREREIVEREIQERQLREKELFDRERKIQERERDLQEREARDRERLAKDARGFHHQAAARDVRVTSEAFGGTPPVYDLFGSAVKPAIKGFGSPQPFAGGARPVFEHFGDAQRVTETFGSGARPSGEYFGAGARVGTRPAVKVAQQSDMSDLLEIERQQMMEQMKVSEMSPRALRAHLLTLENEKRHTLAQQQSKVQERQEIVKHGGLAFSHGMQVALKDNRTAQTALKEKLVTLDAQMTDIKIKLNRNQGPPSKRKAGQAGLLGSPFGSPARPSDRGKRDHLRQENLLNDIKAKEHFLAANFQSMKSGNSGEMVKAQNKGFQERGQVFKSPGGQNAASRFGPPDSGKDAPRASRQANISPGRSVFNQNQIGPRDMATMEHQRERVSRFHPSMDKVSSTASRSNSECDLRQGKPSPRQQSFSPGRRERGDNIEKGRKHMDRFRDLHRGKSKDCPDPISHLGDAVTTRTEGINTNRPLEFGRPGSSTERKERQDSDRSFPQAMESVDNRLLVAQFGVRALQNQPREIVSQGKNKTGEQGNVGMRTDPIVLTSEEDGLDLPTTFGKNANKKNVTQFARDVRRAEETKGLKSRFSERELQRGGQSAHPSVLGEKDMVALSTGQDKLSPGGRGTAFSPWGGSANTGRGGHQQRGRGGQQRGRGGQIGARPAVESAVGRGGARAPNWRGTALRRKDPGSFARGVGGEGRGHFAYRGRQLERDEQWGGTEYNQGHGEETEFDHLSEQAYWEEEGKYGQEEHDWPLQQGEERRHVAPLPARRGGRQWGRGRGAHAPLQPPLKPFEFRKPEEQRYTAGEYEESYNEPAEVYEEDYRHETCTDVQEFGTPNLRGRGRGRLNLAPRGRGFAPGGGGDQVVHHDRGQIERSGAGRGFGHTARRGHGHAEDTGSGWPAANRLGHGPRGRGFAPPRNGPVDPWAAEQARAKYLDGRQEAYFGGEEGEADPYYNNPLGVNFF